MFEHPIFVIKALIHNYRYDTIVTNTEYLTKKYIRVLNFSLILQNYYFESILLGRLMNMIHREVLTFLAYAVNKKFGREHG